MFLGEPLSEFILKNIYWFNKFILEYKISFETVEIDQMMHIIA